MKLPLDCEATYDATFLASDESSRLFEFITSNCDLTDRSIQMADGRHAQLDVGSHTFVDRDLTGFESLPEVFGPRTPWPALVQDLKDRIEAAAGRVFNVCRAIYYKDGTAGADFHSDFPAYGSTDCIASISLGEERTFAMRRRDKPEDIYRLVLADGSLLIVGEHCQDRYEHSLPVDPRYKNPRINLTFRPFGWGDGRGS